ncbi:MAG: dockerin type I repeat-containing protein [Clostridia bacterium]|nr:dockerin type I repeat-containing protein [Clostridia bacterium]
MNRQIRQSLCLILSLTTILLLFSGFTGSSSFKVTPIGDVTGDGGVTSSDARLLICHIIKNTAGTLDARIADCDENGMIDTADARAILNRAMLETPITAEGLPLSSYSDMTDADSVSAYEMTCELSDTYKFSCVAAKSIRITTLSGSTIASGGSTIQADLTAGKTYHIAMQSLKANQSFTMNVTAQNHVIRLPYEARFTSDPEDYETTGVSGNPVQSAEIVYTKRAGGKYIYSNNPEKLASQDIGQALLRDENLTGDVEFTWEHSNFSKRSFYLGYQLKNDSDRDAFVTVTNIGMQVQGEWLGQKAWSDFYNIKFDLPGDYFDENGQESERYQGQDFVDYTPRVFQPTTYRIPAGEYIYVLGGTSNDAYNKTNVANTADKIIYAGKCTNAVVKFRVFGSAVTGTLYCYTSASQVKAEPAEQGYVVSRANSDGELTNYGVQYKGSADHQGLIETNIAWTVNDQTKRGYLPVTYNSYHSNTKPGDGEPYRLFEGTDHQLSMGGWTTHANPQNHSYAIGTDMVDYACETTDGTPITIDVNHADGTGRAANLGNWMIDYQDNYTFVNRGNTARTITIRKYADGALMAMVLDRDGNILSTKCTIQPSQGSKTEYNYDIYVFTLQPHSVEQLTVNFMLMGNSSGSVSNVVWME